MKLIRFGLISFLTLFAIITAISLFIPSHVLVSRAVNMDSRPEAIYAAIANIDEWKNWYPGFDTLKLTPLKTEHAALTAVTIPATATTIVLEKRDPKEIVATFNSERRRPVTSGWKLITYPANDSLTVQWYLEFHLHWYPWEKFLSLTYDNVYGRSMELGLGNLKKMVQGQGTR